MLDDGRSWTRGGKGDFPLFLERTEFLFPPCRVIWCMRRNWFLIPGAKLCMTGYLRESGTQRSPGGTQQSLGNCSKLQGRFLGHSRPFFFQYKPRAITQLPCHCHEIIPLPWHQRVYVISRARLSSNNTFALIVSMRMLTFSFFLLYLLLSLGAAVLKKRDLNGLLWVCTIHCTWTVRVTSHITGCLSSLM